MAFGTARRWRAGPADGSFRSVYMSEGRLVYIHIPHYRRRVISERQNDGISSYAVTEPRRVLEKVGTCVVGLYLAFRIQKSPTLKKGGGVIDLRSVHGFYYKILQLVY